MAIKRRLSRRIHKSVQSGARKYARQMGEIALAWNALQDGLFILFWIVSTNRRQQEYPIAHAIWHSFQSDKAQREMLLAVASANPLLPRKLVDHLKWLVKLTTDLSAYRNAVLHTPVKFAAGISGYVEAIPQ